MADRRHLEKSKNGNGMTHVHEMRHDDAYWPSDAINCCRLMNRPAGVPHGVEARLCRELDVLS